jgi:hypothetical protein
MPANLDRYPIVFGLWKGDLTLKRAIVSAMRRMRQNGQMATIISHYVPNGSAIQYNSLQDRFGRGQ